jgi:hypothetical protein
MESRTLSILPTSIDSQRAYYTIQGGFKYLTKKIRLADFSILNAQRKPIYFDARGIYALIKSISFLDKQGQIIDSMSNTDYMAIKLIHQNNPAQRDVNRLLFQNAGVAVEVPSMGQLRLAEQLGKQDATKIGSYIDLSFMSNYLLARNIADDFMQIQIEFEGMDLFDGGYSFTKPPTLFVDEVLTGQPVDSQDVILYDQIVPDKLPIHKVDGKGAIDQRMNSYTSQLVSNLYLYYLRNASNGTPINDGFTKAHAGMKFNLIIDGKRMLPFGGYDSDARRLAAFTDATGDFLLPAASAYNHDKFASGNELGLYNPNLNKKYAGSHSYSCVALNQVVVGELTIQAESLFDDEALNIQFLQALAEVKRFYKRSTGQVGNFAPGSL